MPKQSVIVDTSPLQYLHQVNCLDLLQKLYSKITVPSAVCEELQVGLLQGVDVPIIRLRVVIQYFSHRQGDRLSQPQICIRQSSSVSIRPKQ